MMTQTFHKKATPTKKMVGVVETVKQLRAMAKTAGLTGYSRMKKDQLVELIETKTDKKLTHRSKPQTRKELTVQAKLHGLKGVSRLSKGQLLEKLQEKIREDRKATGNKIEIHPPQKSLKGAFTTWKITPIAKMDVETFLEISRVKRAEFVEDFALKGAKINVVLHCPFIKINPTGKADDENEGHFHSGNYIFTEVTDLDEILEEMDEKIREKMAQWTSEKSGWTLKEIVKLQVNINKHRPLSGSQYTPLSAWIKAKKAVINVQNRDEECFKWAILSAVHHDKVDQKQTQRVTQYYRWRDELNLEGIEFPVSLKGINKFEKANPTLAINVFEIDKEEIYPLRISDFGEQRGRDINLLLIEGKGRKHYCWIKNMSRLVSSQISDHDGEIHLCYRCFNHFHSKEVLVAHK